MKASQAGHLDVVQALLAKGAEVNAKANNGGTALMLASLAGHPDVVQALLAQGADVNAKTSGGVTALMAAKDFAVIGLLLHAGAKP
jgi:ankyrin repeat protein